MWNKLEKIDWRTISLRIFIFTTLLYLIVLFSNIFFNNIFSFYFNANYLFVIAISAITFYFSQIINSIPENKREKSKLIKAFSYLFLGTLLLVTLNQFLKNEIIINYLFYISCFSIMFGFLAFYARRDRVEKKVEDEKELKRYEEFPKKFLRISKIPIFRGIVRWMYKEKFSYILILTLIIIVISAFCIFKIINTPTINVDEAHSSIAAYGILQTGFPYFPNSEAIYGRSWLHLYLLSGSFFLFGFNEIVGRFLSLFFFIISSLIFYKLLREFISQKKSLFFTFMFLINPWLIYFGILARMYIFLCLFSLLFIYLIVLYDKTKNKIILFVYLPIILILGLLSERTFLIFSIGYIILIATFCYEKRIFIIKNLNLLLKLITISFTILSIFIIIYWQTIFSFISKYIIGFNGNNLFANPQLQFAPLQWLSFYTLPLPLIILLIIPILFTKNKSIRLILFIFIAGELLIDLLIYSNFPIRRMNYSFILFPTYFFLISYGITRIYSILSSKIKILLTIIFLSILILNIKDKYNYISYADMSIIKSIPPQSIILGYPTSPIIFYNIKLNMNDKIYPFITNSIESNLYTYNKKEIYSGKEFISTKESFNKIRKNNDIYLLYEKTRLDFISKEIKDYIFSICNPVNKNNYITSKKTETNLYKFTNKDYSNLNEIIFLKCNKITKIY